MLVCLLAALPGLRLAPPVMRLGSGRAADSFHGCGGAVPFAPFSNGGGSGSNQIHWAPGGQWTARTAVTRGKVVPSGRAMASAANNSTQIVWNAAVGVAAGADMQGCGGATDFAPFSGGGSSSDQSKWAAVARSVYK